MQRRGSLSQSEITTFLEDATIPVRLACRTPQDNLWMCSLWFQLVRGTESGGELEGDAETAESADDSDDWRLQCATAAGADIVSFLEHDPGVSFEVSTNDPPYTGVRGRGSVSIDSDPEKETLRALLERYLEDTESGLAQSLLDEGRDEVTITIEPAVVYGWDFSSRMGNEKSDRSD